MSGVARDIDWDKLTGLFRPGDGDMPPKLAGRELALKSLNKLLLNLTEHKQQPPREAVLYGPRGNGKTVLMSALKRQHAGKNLDIVSLRGKQIDSKTNLATYLLHQREVSMKDTEELTLDKGKVGFNFASGELGKMNRADREAYMTTHLVDLLAARCRNRPLLVAVDEAHTLDVEIGGLLLNASESVRTNCAPFMLMLAGTPNLREHLGKMDASFWGRAEKIGIGRLAADATREALADPLEPYGIQFEPDALEMVVAESQHYPYFIQLWGEVLCEALAEEKTTCIDMPIVDAARRRFTEVRNDYYKDRYEELRKQRLLLSARSVANVFQSEHHIDDEELGEHLVANLHMNADSADSVLEELSDLGFIWQPAASTCYEPGIPSLMDYVLTKGRDSIGERNPY